MVAVLGVIFLFIAGFGCGSCERSTQCFESCVSKIPDNPQLCNDTCLQLLNSANNITSNISTELPPTPDEPVLFSSGYFTFTLDWRSYSETKYNASPVVYVLEVTRHENITDPFTIMPLIQKYHMTKNTTFTIPEEFVTKTNYSFRLAVVTLQGTSNFSLPSLLYTTNSSCERVENYYNASLPVNPCPVFNVRVSFTVSPIPFERPNISTVIHWDLPHDVHNLEEDYIALDITLDLYTKSCINFGLSSHFIHTFPGHQATSYDELLPVDSTFYFGCRYEVKLLLDYVFETSATFNIPNCIHGFCSCDGLTTSSLEKSKYINIHVEEETGINRTTINVTWSIQPWKKQPAFFKLVMLECVRGRCPPLFGHRREVVVADSLGMKTNYSFAFQNRTKDEKHYITVAAFDSSGCQLSPKEGQEFYARVTLPTTVPGTFPTTAPTTTEGVIVSETGGLSSSTVAAITVPIVLLFVITLLLLGFLWYYHKHKKPSRLHRAPTGLLRLAANLDDRNNYGRNLSDDPSSPYANDYDRVNLAVHIEGGLELNPAYVEQRIQESVETGEADEFEFGFHRLELKRVLGKGAFGKVFLAEAYGMGETGQDTSLVAVKVLNDKATEDEVEDFKMEINFMKTIGLHENVVTMLGCCTLYPPLCLLVEYVPHGDLLHYLRDLRKTFEKQNRVLQGEDITSLKNNEKSSFSQSTTECSETTSPGSYSHRPLVPSLSDTAVSAANQLQKTPKPPSTQPRPSKPNVQRQLLRQCKSEGKQLTISNWIKKYEKFLEPSEKGTFNRSHSSGSLQGLKAVSPARRYSEVPKAHHTARGTTDETNNTQTTLVFDSKEDSKAQATSATRAPSLDGALDASELQSFAFQIANGMAYLSGKGIVHRDLAARNILVGDEKVLKISDFGLSREGIYVKRSTGKIPLRWLSVEAMRDRVYSTASDIWAFGIVLWEICTLGGFPYPTISDMNLLNFLLEGSRMEKPNNCTDEIYQIMLACWSRECEDRPSFQTLSEELYNMQKEEQPYVNVDPSQSFILPPTAGRDTVGNLIAFSDGTFSGETADHDEVEMMELPKTTSPAKMSLQSELSPSREEENAGYESSNDSEDLSASFENTADNEIGPSEQKEKPVDIDDTNFIFVV